MDIGHFRALGTAWDLSSKESYVGPTGPLADSGFLDPSGLMASSPTSEEVMCENEVGLTLRHSMTHLLSLRDVGREPVKITVIGTWPNDIERIT